MSLNPVQFGKDVIDQFGRYLLTTFPVADARLEQQVKDRLRHTINSDNLLYKGPYVYLNRPFQQGPTVEALIAERGVHPALRGVFPYPALHYHQAEALAAVQAEQHLILSTGTGSGKTEAFMLPIIDHCLRLRDAGDADGVVAVIVYPMNALVNDQLERLRWTLAGTRITFGRYTGETESHFPDDHYQQNAPVGYTAAEREQHKQGAIFGTEALPLPWEECYDQETIRLKRPRILLTNYAQLEYLLLRNRDLDLFRGAPLRYIVMDEVHTYTGALGSEVACLLRRLRDVAQKQSDEVIMIGTSATVSDKPDDGDGEAIDAEAMTRRFAHRLFGVPQEQIAVVRETYRDLDQRETYVPPLPHDAIGLLDAILTETRSLQLQTDIDAGDVSAELVRLTAALCGQTSSGQRSGMDQLGELLYSNRGIRRLSEIFTEPTTWEDALPRWRRMGGGRERADDDTLIAEMLAYLTLGALVIVDGDPLLRPKLHYFVQGLQGLSIEFSPHMDPEIRFSETERFPPLLLCRSCGQHYTRLITEEWEASNDSPYAYKLAKIPGDFEEPENDVSWLYLTDRFHTEDNEDEDGAQHWGDVYVCTHCHTVHEKHESACLNPKCREDGPLLTLRAYQPDTGGTPKKCGACGGPNTAKTPLISYTRSAGVADVTILVQSMLSMMSEKPLRKVLVFADSRQEAAFQAGWMQERAKRFRLRHLAYQIIREKERPTGWDDYVLELIARAQQSGILPRKDFDDQNQQIKIRWFLIEEFAFVTQRRSNLEQLGLLGIVYGGLENTDDPFFYDWAERLDCSPAQVRDCIWLLLDIFRRRGMLSDPLLARWWSDQDPEVYQGLVSIPDFYRPTALVLTKSGKKQVINGLISKTGRSTAQVALGKAFGPVSAKTRDAFLEAVWQWLIDNNYLGRVELTQRRRGQAQAIANLPRDVYQVNVNRIGITTIEEHYVCTHCHRAQQVMTPSHQCPEYRCNGTLQPAGMDQEHFDVVQYTRQEYVPLDAREHSAQVPRERRLEAERMFKSEDGHINTIVATPTLEMGVDIGKLEMVLMRNVPPTPANYAQRAGRAGRRHRIGAVFTYAGMSQHDRYFYADPPEAIAGAVRVPAFSMQNEPLIRKHVHSATLTALREWTSPEEQDSLRETFPTYIRSYLAEWHEDGDRPRYRYFTKAPEFPGFRELLKQYRSQLITRLVSIFSTDWPEDDQHAVSQELLTQYLDEMPDRLDRHIRLLFGQVKAYRDSLSELRQIEIDNEGLRVDERKQRQRLEQARDSYLKNAMENYTLSWLAVDGFFPGYALSRDSVRATCIQPLVEMSRPSAIALRELTPANWVYADGRVFGVQRLNFGKLKATDAQFTPENLREEMLLDKSNKRLYLPENAATEGGNSEVQKVISYELTDVEMEQVQNIDDRRELRRRIAFNIIGTLLSRHSGGKQGRVGDKTYRFLQRETVRLVNLGPTRTGPIGVEGFPICPTCGESRSPWSSQTEIDHFRDAHRERCGISDIQFFALHVNLVSDVLAIGPYDSTDQAVNAYEGLLTGARALLDMGGSELDGFFYLDEHGATWAVLYDPLPGGTGFLPQLLNYWQTICERGAEALDRCDCQTSCYKCLRHFRNQQFHEVLDRHQAMQQLNDLNTAPYVEHDIPATVTSTTVQDTGTTTESLAEAKFLKVLEDHRFPFPSKQFKVDLGNGNYTVADFAWTEKNLLVFIDGTSMHLHGDPERARRDNLNRHKANLLGWHVIAITAQELDDQTALSMKLDAISFYLEQ